MRIALRNNEKVRKRLDRLPKIYLVGYWGRYGVMSFPFTKKCNKEGIPLVYDYYDGNGTCDLYLLTNINDTTTGRIMCWTMNKCSADIIANSLNIKEEVDIAEFELKELLCGKCPNYDRVKKGEMPEDEACGWCDNYEKV